MDAVVVVPKYLKCPLSNQLLDDPVIASDGFTYSRRVILRYFEQFKNDEIVFSPAQEGVEMKHSSLMENRQIKMELEAFREDAIETIERKVNTLDKKVDEKEIVSLLKIGFQISRESETIQNLIRVYFKREDYKDYHYLHQAKEGVKEVYSNPKEEVLNSMIGLYRKSKELDKLAEIYYELVKYYLFDVDGEPDPLKALQSLNLQLNELYTNDDDHLNEPLLTKGCVTFFSWWCRSMNMLADYFLERQFRSKAAEIYSRIGDELLNTVQLSYGVELTHRTFPTNVNDVDNDKLAIEAYFKAYYFDSTRTQDFQRFIELVQYDIPAYLEFSTLLYVSFKAPDSGFEFLKTILEKSIFDQRENIELKGYFSNCLNIIIQNMENKIIASNVAFFKAEHLWNYENPIEKKEYIQSLRETISLNPKHETAFKTLETHYQDELQVGTHSDVSGIIFLLHNYLMQISEEKEILLDRQKAIFLKPLLMAVETIHYMNKEITTLRNMTIGKHFEYRHDFDTNGLFYYLGTLESGRGKIDSWKNPHVSKMVEVSASEVLDSSTNLSFFIGRSRRSHGQSDKPNSWFMVNLKNYKLKPTAYTLRHGNPTSHGCLQNWVFEGSNDGETFDCIYKHEDEEHLKKPWGTHTWKIHTQFYYQYFRIRITGKNSADRYFIDVSGMELYGHALYQNT